MPRIPVYERAVAPQPGQPAELRVASSPEDFGAGLAAGLNAVGAGMNELARKQYELDVAKKVNDAEALYAQGVNAVFYAPGGELRPIPASDFTVQVPGGVAMLHGDAAVNAAPAAADAIKRVRKQIYDSLDGDAASLFYHRTQRDEDQHLESIGRLATTGALEARKTAREASNAAAIDATLRNPFDDKVSDAGMAKYVANERIGVIDAGGTKEAGDVAAQEAVQKWMRTRANAMAEAGQFAAAIDYLKRPDVVAALGTEADALRYKWRDHGLEDVASGIVSKVVESVTRRDAAGKAVGFDSVKGWEQLEDAFDKAGATPVAAPASRWPRARLCTVKPSPPTTRASSTRSAPTTRRLTESSRPRASPRRGRRRRGAASSSRRSTPSSSWRRRRRSRRSRRSTIRRTLPPSAK